MGREGLQSVTRRPADQLVRGGELSAAFTSTDSPKAPAPLTSTGMFSDSSASAYGAIRLRLLPGENEEVTELATAGIDFRSNVGRDPFGIPLEKLLAIAVVSHSEDAPREAVAPACIERCEARRVRSRLGRE